MEVAAIGLVPSQDQNRAIVINSHIIENILFEYSVTHPDLQSLYHQFATVVILHPKLIKTVANHPLPKLVKYLVHQQNSPTIYP